MRRASAADRRCHASVSAALVYVVWRYRDQLATILDVLRGGTWYLVFAMIMVLGIAIYNQALLYASIYDLLALFSRGGNSCRSTW